MFYWPTIELTDYEKRFVSLYKTKDRPGVMRRTYKVLLNNTINSTVPGLEVVHNEGAIQIARRSRVFGLTFGGDTNIWRLNISTASGEVFTPKFAGGADPVVNSLTAGSMWNIYATDLNSPSDVPGGEGSSKQMAFSIMPMLIEPNWELSPNEQLIFRGISETDNSILEIGVHAWEFPGMVMGAVGCGAPPSKTKVGAK
jgi:hypothetical protein